MPEAIRDENTGVTLKIDTGGIARVSISSLPIDKFQSVTGWTESTGADNLATTTTHRGYGSTGLTFDKINGDADAMISKTVTSFDMNSFTEQSILHAQVYISDLTNVSKCFVRFGTDSSNYMQWDVADSAMSNGWNEIEVEILRPTSQTGDGADFGAITYIAVGVTFDNSTDTLVGIITSGWFIAKTTPIVIDLGDDIDLDIRDLTATDIVTVRQGTAADLNVTQANGLLVTEPYTDIALGYSGGGNLSTVIYYDGGIAAENEVASVYLGYTGGTLTTVETA